MNTTMGEGYKNENFCFSVKIVLIISKANIHSGFLRYKPVNIICNILELLIFASPMFNQLVQFSLFVVKFLHDNSHHIPIDHHSLG